MIINENSFENIESFIEHLKKNENVIGIVEYGKRTYTDMSARGDYDLTVIFDKPISTNFTGVHFHIKDIPVDCMLLSKQDFLSDMPLNDFLFVHLNCKILYDECYKWFTNTCKNMELRILKWWNFIWRFCRSYYLLEKYRNSVTCR